MDSDYICPQCNKNMEYPVVFGDGFECRPCGIEYIPNGPLYYSRDKCIRRDTFEECCRVFKNLKVFL